MDRIAKFLALDELDDDTVMHGSVVDGKYSAVPLKRDLGPVSI